MMQFEEIDFMTPLREFLVQYPNLRPGERLEITYMDIDPSNPNRPEGEAFAFVGSSINLEVADILDTTTASEQSNFVLILRRYTQDNEFRRDVGNFLINYIRWINFEQSRRGKIGEHPLLPKFGMTLNEKISANGGVQTGVGIEIGVDEFQIQLQCQYQTVYQEEY